MNLLRTPAASLAVMGVAMIAVSLRPGPAGASAVVPHVAPPMSASVHTVAAHRRTVHHRHHRHHRRHGHRPPTSWPALNRAIARIPSYHRGAARWVVSGRYGHWGTADWYHDTLYISPAVPTAFLYDVAVHEWSHELSVRDYGGDVAIAVRAMNRFFGGPGFTGAERAADCMARLQGATWTHYTSCTSHRWRVGAARLLHGRAL